MPGCVQLNFQTHLGGGEIYTAFVCRALSMLGIKTRLLVHPQAKFWGQLSLPADIEIVRTSAGASLRKYLPEQPIWLLAHGPLPIELRAVVPQHLRTAIAHMPIQGRNAMSFDGHDMVFPVSGWVRDGLIAAGIPSWHQPLYGVADLSRASESNTITRNSRYDWDRRKLRDRLLSWIEPSIESLRPHPAFVRRPGLALGIVSRITPIKQFPLLFSQLAPVLAKSTHINLEFFGSGGYASIRDIDRALQPIVSKVRFWGHQSNVTAAYRCLDYLMTGLPEKEALGLNIIEAQNCGLPVLAPKAPPFMETIVDGKTGFLYDDPRKDNGRSFGLLLEKLQALPKPLNPQDAPDCLTRFSFDAFIERLRPVIRWVSATLP